MPLLSELSRHELPAALDAGIVHVAVDAPALRSFGDATQALVALADCLELAQCTAAVLYFSDATFADPLLLTDAVSGRDATAPKDYFLAVQSVQRAVRALEQMGKPIAAVVNVPTRGIAAALMLACRYRVGPVSGPVVTLGATMPFGVIARVVQSLGVLKSTAWLLAEHDPAETDDTTSRLLIDACAISEAERAELALQWAMETHDALACSPPWDRKGFRLPLGGLYEQNNHQRLALLSAAAAGRFDARRALRHALLATIADAALVRFDAADNAEMRRYTMFMAAEESVTNVKRVSA